MVRDAGANFAREAILDSYEAYDQGNQPSSYRSAPPMADDGEIDEHDPVADGVADAREQAYAEYDRRTADAWKGGCDV